MTPQEIAERRERSRLELNAEMGAWRRSLPGRWYWLMQHVRGRRIQP